MESAVGRNLARHESHAAGEKQKTGSAHSVVPPLDTAKIKETNDAPKSTGRGKLSHRHSTKFAVTPTPGLSKRSTNELVKNVEGFVSDIVKTNLKDKDVVDIDRLLTLKSDLQHVVGAYEARPEFKINEKMSARKRELDELIAQAEKEFAENKLKHAQQIDLLENRLLEIHRKVTEVQGQTLIKQLKDMEEYQYYHNKVIQQIADIQSSLDMQGCCSHLFFCFLSKEILQKRKQLDALYQEQDALASEDRSRVSLLLMSKIEGERVVINKQLEQLINNQPQETAQKLQEERMKLQADIEANRETYYHTINPAVMLNLIRIQSFINRMQGKIEKAHDKAESQADIVAAGLLYAVLTIVKAFSEKFNKMCLDFACRPPYNQSNKISYAQYYDRYHKLEDKEKRLIIKGSVEEGDMQKMGSLFERLFPEHTHSELRAESSAQITDKALTTKV